MQYTIKPVGYTEDMMGNPVQQSYECEDWDAHKLQIDRLYMFAIPGCTIEVWTGSTLIDTIKCD